MAFVHEVEPLLEGINQIGDVPVLFRLACDINGDLPTTHVVLDGYWRLYAVKYRIEVDALCVGASKLFFHGVGHLWRLGHFLVLSKVMKGNLIHFTVEHIVK